MSDGNAIGGRIDRTATTWDSEAPAGLIEEALSASGVGVWIWDITSDTLQYSDEWARMIGYEPDELDSGANAWEQLVHPADLQRYRAELSHHLAGLTAQFVSVHRLKTKSGSYCWVRAQGERRPQDLRRGIQRLVGTQINLDALHGSGMIGAIPDALLFENLPIGFAVVDLQGRWIQVNAAMCRLVGFTRDELLSTDFQSLTHPEDLHDDLAAVNRLVQSGTSPVTFDDGQIDRYQMRKRYISSSGTLVPAMLDVTLIRDAAGHPQHFISAVQDISEVQRRDLHIQQQELLAEVTLSSIADGVLRLNRAGRITYVNRAAELMLHYTHATMLGMNGDALLGLKVPGPAATTTFTEALDAVFQQGSTMQFPSGTELHGSDYRSLHVECSMAPVRRPGGEIAEAVFVFHDTTEAQRLTAELVYQTNHDMLTELANRRHFQRQLELIEAEVVELGSTASVLYLDLDQFKQINDSHGHHVGDRALKAVARCLKRFVEPQGMAARVGGDEFAAVLRGVDTVRTVEKVKQLLAEIRQIGSVLDIAHVTLNASIGIARLDPLTSNAVSSLIQADLAATVAKAQGGGGVAVFDEVETAVSANRSLAMWRPVIEAVMQERRLLLYGQQIVDASGTLRGCELLLRYQGIDGVVRTPEKLIWAVEQLAWTTRLDVYVLDAADALLAANRLPSPLELAINVCGRSLCDAAFQERLRTFCQTHSAWGARLTFEITETSSLNDIEFAASFMAALRAQYGVSFALDDFGTGYATFNYLRDIPVQTVKLSRNFIEGLNVNPLNQLIVKSIADIARHLGLTIVAEGIETEEEMAVLQGMGIERFQGWLFHRAEPLPW